MEPTTADQLHCLYPFLHHIRFHFRKASESICTLRCRLRNFRDQMYHRGLCHEGLPGFLDSLHQVDRITIGDCFWTLSWERGAKRTLRGMYWKRHFALLRKVPTECRKNKGDLERLRGSWGGSGLWESHRWSPVLSRGNEVAPAISRIPTLTLRRRCQITSLFRRCGGAISARWSPPQSLL